jgi:hypothetical protein
MIFADVPGVRRRFGGPMIIVNLDDAWGTGSDSIAPGEVALNLDEVDIHLKPRIGPAWTLADRQTLMVRSGDASVVRPDRPVGEPTLEDNSHIITVTRRPPKRDPEGGWGRNRND